MAAVTRVLLCSPTLEGRARLEALVAEFPEAQRVGATLRWADLPGAVDAVLPDAILAEGDPADDDAWAALGAAAAAVPTVLLSSGTRVDEARRHDIGGLLRSDATSEEVDAALRAVRLGLIVLVPEPAQMRPASGEPLTQRERQVLALLAEGAGNKEIASRLGISDHTVKYHLASVFGKLGVATRTEAVTAGVRRGWIML